MVVRTRQGLAFAGRHRGYKTLTTCLREQRIIDQTVFAFHLADNSDTENQQSVISFGSWDVGKYALEEEFTYIDIIENSSCWQLPLSEFRIAGTILPNLTPQGAMINSRGTFIELPTKEYELFRSKTCGTVQCDPESWDIVFQCPNGEEKRLSDMSFVLNGVTFSVSSKHYIFKRDSVCSCLVYRAEFCSLGLPFLRAYYTLFDEERLRIGLARSINFPYPSNLPKVVLVILTGLGIALVFYLCRIYLCRRKAVEPVNEANPANHLEPLIPADFHA